MAKEQVQKFGWQSSSQKKQSKIVPPPIDDLTQADSLPLPKVKMSGLPSKEEREAIKRKIFGNWTEAEPIQAKTEIVQPMVQLQSSGGGMTSTPDLETSIQQARSCGQSISDNIREPMEQVFGADFSGVKVHTDAQSNELNRSIQAKAFTTGQDIFFRQGAYDPGSRGGLELIAHELTHVVQQNGTEYNVQRYVEDGEQIDDRLKGVRISEMGRAIVKSPQELYATEDLIKEAQAQLAKANAGINIEKGSPLQISEQAITIWKQRFKSYSELYKVIPVHKEAPPKQENQNTDTFERLRREGTQPSIFGSLVDKFRSKKGDAPAAESFKNDDELMRELSPKEGDTEQVILEKHERYKKYVSDFYAPFNTFAQNLLKALQSNILKDSGQQGQTQSLKIQREQGLKVFSQVVSDWSRKYQKCNSALQNNLLELQGIINQKEFEFKDVKDWLTTMSSEKIPKIVSAEVEADASAIVLFNDCAVAASHIARKDLSVLREQSNDNPAVGNAYLKEFDKNLSVGWNTHWATVIMKDGKDNITLETAAGEGQARMGKANWYFQMYGTEQSQDFKTQIEEISARRNIAVLEERETRGVISDSERTQLEHERKTLQRISSLQSS